jgi:hypothetical protein
MGQYWCCSSPFCCSQTCQQGMLRTPNKPQHKTLQNRLQLYHLSLSTYKRTCSNSTAGYWTCAADCCGKGLQCAYHQLTAGPDRHASSCTYKVSSSHRLQGLPAQGVFPRRLSPWPRRLNSHMPGLSPVHPDQEGLPDATNV